MTAMDVWLVVGAAALVLLAALLAMADAGLSRVSRLQVEDAVRDRERGADALSAVVADPARYLNVVLFVRKLAEFSAAGLVTLVCLGAFTDDWVAVLVAIGVMTVASYVVVGVGARTLGRQHARRVALVSATPVRALRRVLGPLASLLILIGNAVTPGRGFREGPFASEAELRDLVDLAEENRLIQDDERQMIHSVFELGDTFVREVMVPRTDVVFVERSKTLRQFMSLALRSGFSRIPVVGEDFDDVLGIVYLKDVVRRTYEHRDAETSERVEQLMRPAVFVPDSKPADELLRDLQAQRIHLAVVVDEYGGTAGIVTIEDVLEEIVGEITDEYDSDLPDVEELPEGALRVSARLHIDDLAELMDLEIEDDDVDTVGGLLSKALGNVPIAGSEVAVHGLRLRAESLHGRRNQIGTVLVRRVDGKPCVPEHRREPADITESADA